VGSSFRVKIGEREVKAMQPNTILWDLEVKGFVARRQFSEVITFSVVYRTKENVQRWQKLERYPILTAHLARQEAIKVLRAKAMGQDPAAEKMALRSAPTVSELCDEYQARDNGKKPETIRADKSRIKVHIKPTLGKLKVSSVTSDHVEDFMRSMSQGSKRRNLGLLGAIFSYAVKRKLRPDNPCSRIEKPTQVKRTRRLSDLEYAQLGTQLNGGTLSDIFLILRDRLAQRRSQKSSLVGARFGAQHCNIGGYENRSQHSSS
jgi:Phage integrase, N-terminal SAM-like domain